MKKKRTAKKDVHVFKERLFAFLHYFFVILLLELPIQLMRRDWKSTRLNCEGNLLVHHPEPYDSVVYIASSGQGIVFSAYDSDKQKHVAIKKTKHDLRNIRQLQNTEQMEKYEFAKNVYREFELGMLVKHKNIMSILDAYTPDDTFQNFKSVYLIFEMMNLQDLRHFHVLKWNEICNYQSGAPLIADLILQLFSAIAYLHQDNLKLIHRDIKPDNILIKDGRDGKYVLKLGDLGHARKIPPLEGQPMTQNLTTCQYRAPEIIQHKNYSIPADIWSAGCVLAELLIQPKSNEPSPLFNSNIPQVVEQMHYELMETTISTKFADNQLPQWRDIEKWGEYFRFILENTLKLNPNERITASQIIVLNTYDMLNMEKYRFKEVSEPYEEKAEDFRKPSDWRMKIYDKLEKFNQKREEEIQSRQEDDVEAEAQYHI